ncbi:MAG: alpha/beta hydrolase [Candidatus Binataceae bacterium]
MAANAAKIFLHYSQEELDRNYNQRAWVSNADELMGRWASNSAAVSARIAHRADVSYGPSADEVLDIFTAHQANAPILVFIHGGAWRALTKKESCYAAEAFVNAGAHFIAVNFAVIPKVRMPDMIAQVRRALGWVYHNARSFSGDPERIYVAGHSSGAHMAGVMLVTDWAAFGGLPANLIKGGFCTSGMYDLEPVMLSARSDYVKISKAEEVELSPIKHLERLSCPVVLGYGGKETNEFQRQTRDFAASLERIGKLSKLLFFPRLNHFEVAEELAKPDGQLCRAAFHEMGLTGV